MTLKWSTVPDGHNQPFVFASLMFNEANQDALWIVVGRNVTPGWKPYDTSLWPLGQWNNASFDHGAFMYVYGDDNFEPITTGWYAVLAALTDSIEKLVYWTLLADLGQSANNTLANPRGLMVYSYAMVQDLCLMDV